MLQGLCEQSHQAFLRVWSPTWLVLTEGEYTAVLHKKKQKNDCHYLNL